MTEFVRINDVGPRDGLQNQATILSPAQRLELIHALVVAGLPAIEVGSFVSPKAVPAMAGASEIVTSLNKDGVNKQAYLQSLIPNQKGYELAKEAGAEAVLLVVCATETMNQKNVRMSIYDGLAQAQDIISQAKTDKIDVLTCIAVAWECPFEGKTSPKVVIDLAAKLAGFGAKELVIADTIGAATPKSVFSLMSELSKQHSQHSLACHFHDTRAMGLANVYAALEAGIRRFDASVGGLGGCPFAPGATGNVATEDVVMMLHQMGFNTGIDLEKLMAVGQLAGQMTHTQTGGRAHNWRQLQLDKGKALF
ncbi:hydroxymethylglutaryl-CoA lyase [Paraglaciecola hydrolytica]|uniref:Hydroxymethylglutaryl-CoA lyase n=1 Tax=Paraglaciecola hydrolytica TaxID=1799789 RepID=A0A136A5C6_9ALTE|nr:hydroxymethylglutaryl-CoA lyase [Paraglaciecola hydrolytica]KXI30448.1 hydroxymethylglutaryl-CoA lyase [Paraglaciecola hydrolytica]